MNLYDRIKPGKRRRGWGGAVFLAAACVVLVICIGTIGWAARYHQRYRRFSTDFAASVENAGKIGAALTRNGETSSLDPDASSRLCRLICAAGAGKVQPSCPQGGAAHRPLPQRRGAGLVGSGNTRRDRQKPHRRFCALYLCRWNGLPI